MVPKSFQMVPTPNSAFTIISTPTHITCYINDAGCDVTWEPRRTKSNNLHVALWG